jgi:uncharacterized membrane protein
MLVEARGCRAVRLQALDAARGTAMLLVCLSHFGSTYFRDMPLHLREKLLIVRIGMIASPTFVILSGLLLGLLLVGRASTAADLRAKLVDRGLFMLTIGHILLEVAEAPLPGGSLHVVRWCFITDVIALGFLLGPTLVQQTRVGERLVLAGGLYAIGWIGFLTWHPDGAVLQLVQECLFGAEQWRLLAGGFPIVPWLAIFIGATAAGEYLGQMDAVRAPARMKSLLTWLVGALLLGGLGCKLVIVDLQLLGFLSRGSLPTVLGWQFQKCPPSPVYVGLYAGLGLLMIRALLTAEESPRFRRWLAAPAAVGRASLVAYIAQSYVYFTLMNWWRLPYTMLWPILLVASAAAVVAAALLWRRLGDNDYLAVGYRSLRLGLQVRVTS